MESGPSKPKYAGISEVVLDLKTDVVHIITQ